MQNRRIYSPLFSENHAWLYLNKQWHSIIVQRALNMSHTKSVLIRFQWPVEILRRFPEAEELVSRINVWKTLRDLHPKMRFSTRLQQEYNFGRPLSYKQYFSCVSSIQPKTQRGHQCPHWSLVKNEVSCRWYIPRAGSVNNSLTGWVPYGFICLQASR